MCLIYEIFSQKMKALEMCVLCFSCRMHPFLHAALSPVHPAAFHAPLAGDPLRREDNEKRSALRVKFRFCVINQMTLSLLLML